MSATVERVVNGQLCSGCGLCASISGGAITMEQSAAGYSRPRQLAALQPAREAIIAKACPGAVVAAWQAAPYRHPVWGPHYGVYTGCAVDKAVQFKGSSGGVLTALVAYALTSGLVDRVVHIIASSDDPAGNLVRCSTTPDEVIEGAGSRYISSSPLQDIDRVLTDGGSVVIG